MRDMVCGFGRTEQGGIVLIHKKRGPASVRGMLNGVGGHIEDDDKSPAHAMAREFLEEAGIETKASDWHSRVVLIGARGDWRVYFFAADLPKGCNPITATDENVSVAFLPNFHQLSVVPNLHWIVPLCFDTHIAGPVMLTDVS